MMHGSTITATLPHNLRAQTHLPVQHLLHYNYCTLSRRKMPEIHRERDREGQRKETKIREREKEKIMWRSGSVADLVLFPVFPSHLILCLSERVSVRTKENKKMTKPIFSKTHSLACSALKPSLLSFFSFSLLLKNEKIIIKFFFF